jgi:hypothetical protein
MTDPLATSPLMHAGTDDCSAIEQNLVPGMNAIITSSHDA